MTGIRSIVGRPAPLIATIVLAVQSVVYYSGSGKESNPHIAPWSQFPEVVNDWKTTGDLTMDPEFLNALRPDDYLIRNYASGDSHPVNLFIGYFNSRRDSRAPHSPQWCLPGAGWKSISATVINIPLSGQTRALPANEYIIEKGEARNLILYWYHQGTRTVAYEVAAQFYSLPDLIFHGRTDTALVRIIVPIYGGDLESARTVGTAFAQGVYPLIFRHIS